MSEDAIRQWLIECFGPEQGEQAYEQLSQLPESLRDQLMSQDPSALPSPEQMKQMMQMFMGGGSTAASMFGMGGMNGMNMGGSANGDAHVPAGFRSAAADAQANGVDGAAEAGADAGNASDAAVDVNIAKTIARQYTSDSSSESVVTATDGETMRRAMTEANLWLDTATEFNPVAGDAEALTRTSWIDGTIDQWAKFAAPVASSMCDAMNDVINDRLGDQFGGEITGMFAGPIPIPIPENMRDPKKLMRQLAKATFSMQLGNAAGALSHEVRGSFDQGLALLKNPAGGLIMQNVKEYAKSLELDEDEVTTFLALHEEAYARLFATVPWLMPRFEALLGKYARGITIDLDAMEDELRDADGLDPDSLSGALNLTNVGMSEDTPEQKDAMRSLENLLALVEGWVDCVMWRAGMAHLPHIDQLREMMRRERAVGGPAERTFENLIGLQLRPKRMREAAQLWEKITAEQGIEARDAMWSHPDLLPQLAAETDDADAQENANTEADSAPAKDSIDWDAELSKLLDESADDGDATDSDAGNDGERSDADNAGDDNANGDSGDGDGSDGGSDSAPSTPSDTPADD